MKAWVRSLSTERYSFIFNLVNWGGCGLGLVALFALKNWALWGIVFGAQMIGCYFLSKFRYGCDECGRKHCSRHRFTI